MSCWRFSQRPRTHCVCSPTKCFEGIAKLQFTEDQKVTAVISSEKEHVPLSKTIVPADAKVSTPTLILLLCLERLLASPPLPSPPLPSPSPPLPSPPLPSPPLPSPPLPSPPLPSPPGYGGKVVTAGTRGDDSEFEGRHDTGSDRIHRSPSNTVGDRVARSGRHRSKLHLLDY